MAKRVSAERALRVRATLIYAATLNPDREKLEKIALRMGVNPKYLTSAINEVTEEATVIRAKMVERQTRRT